MDGHICDSQIRTPAAAFQRAASRSERIMRSLRLAARFFLSRNLKMRVNLIIFEKIYSVSKMRVNRVHNFLLHVIY